MEKIKCYESETRKIDTKADVMLRHIIALAELLKDIIQHLVQPLPVQIWPRAG